MKIKLLAAIMFFGYGLTPAQEQNKSLPLIPKAWVQFSNCEENNLNLSSLNHNTSKNDLIIIISHLGKDENKDFGQRRLHNAETFFIKGFRSEYSRQPETILVAEGKKVDGRGYLDFYIGGKLELRLSFNKNQDLRLPPCAFNLPEEKPCSTTFEKLFYPCKNNQ